MSTSIDILSGIPQGCALSTILFIIFRNDLPDVLISTVKIFADDSKQFQAVRSMSDHFHFDNLVDWSRLKWQMGFTSPNVNSFI